MAKDRTDRFSGKEVGVPEAKMARRTLIEVVTGAAEGLLELTIETGRQVLERLLEEDRSLLCGAAKGKHVAGRERYRYGHDEGVLVLGGRKVRVKKPRVRGVDGREVPLPTYARFSREDPLLARAYEQMVVGVSTRKYGRSLEPLPMESNSTSRSAVSRRFVAQTESQLQDFLSRPLTDEFPVVMIDGLHVEEHVLLVALGIDRDGQKQVLGLWEGSTEHETTCRGLLGSLVERGLKAEQPRLFVLDGAKGLRKAVVRVFGKWAVIARCRKHKLENVVGQVPESKKAWVRKQLQRAYASETAEKAERSLRNLARTLESSHPSAAASIREGLDDTLTIHRLNLNDTLARSLWTTNPIENLNGALRNLIRRVKRWRGGSMILRWGATAALEAEKSFRRIKGYRHMPALISSLAALCSTGNNHKLDIRRKVA